MYSLSEKIYQQLLRLYPTDFRRAYGAQMTQLFRDLCRDAQRRRAGWGIADLWLHTLTELGVTASQAHLMQLRRLTMKEKSWERFFEGLAVALLLLSTASGNGLWLFVTAAALLVIGWFAFPAQRQRGTLAMLLAAAIAMFSVLLMRLR